MVGTREPGLREPATAPPTPEQRRAADPSRSVWVTANAGTGKTRVLSDRVLRLLLAGAAPESILCLTFTRAAAAEMTERIETRLAAWAVEPEDARLAADIEALTGVPADAATVMRARRLFAAVLDLPRGLPVTTIHGFAAELLQRFPLEAGVAPHFEVLDVRTRAELAIEAREQVLESVRLAKGRGELAQSLERLAVWLRDQSLADALDTVLANRLELLALRQAHQGLDGLLGALRRELGVPEDPKEPPEIVAEAMERADFDGAALRSAARELAASNAKTDRERGATILAWLDGAFDDAVTGFDVYRRAFFRQDGRPLASLGTKAITEGSRQTLLREQARLLRVEDRIRSLLAWRRTEALLRVGFAVIDARDALEAHRAGLGFDDLVDRAARLLDSAIDWVRYKLDARIDHILVDEAQDTSPVQWAIVEKLAEEFFAGEGAKTGPRTLFVVGDEKQSIYRFQGADLATFRAVRERFRERARTAGLPFAEVALTRSFRSTEAVLDVVDAVFARPEARAGVLDPGAVLRHDTQRRGEPGLVELWPLAEATAKEQAQEPWPLPDRVRTGEEPEALVASAIVRTIAGWLQAGELLESRGRPLRPGDIMVLVRRRGTIQERIVRGLEAAGVPVAGIDRLALADHLAVQDLLALGRVVLLPEDDYSLACLLKSPLLGLGEEQLFELAHGRGRTSLLERLRERAGRDAPGGPFAAAYARLAEWLRRADFMPPFEFYGWVLGADGGRRRLLERLGVEAEEPIEAFLGQLLAYEEGHPASLRGFVHWFGLASEELQRDPGRSGDAVRVLTVHGAKGLEAPVVFLADAGPHGEPQRGRLLWAQEQPGGHRLPFWRVPKPERPAKLEAAAQAEKEAEAEEDRRLLYVALTRAADRLYVAGWKPARGDGESWHGHVRAALEGLAGVERVPCELGPGFSGEILRHRRGTAVPRAREEPSPPAAEVVLPPWLGEPAPAESPPPKPRVPSAGDPEAPAPPPPGKPGERRQYARGAALHRLFELLPGLPAEEREAAAMRLLPLLLPELDSEGHRQLWLEVDRVLAMPELAPAFGPGARAEQPLAGEIDGVQVVGQVDRYVVTADEVLIVDFKSHLQPPEPSDIPAVYLRQMQLYVRLLARIHPGRRVRAALVWTAIPRVDVVWTEPPRDG
jgi:ATP-dependent helicase/nuclease subunit A